MFSVVLLASAFAAASPSANGSVIAVLPPDRSGYWQFEKDTVKPPEYPLHALRSHISGCAAVAFVIEANGTVSSAWPVVETAHSGFGKVASESVSRWRFKPGPENLARKPVYTYDIVGFFLTDPDSTTTQRDQLSEQVKSACELKGLPVKESAVQPLPATQ
ncbi:MAG: TonB family protein [Rhodanobacteraceae bacterium]